MPSESDNNLRQQDLLKNSGIFNTGSQTVRNHDNYDEKILEEDSSENNITGTPFLIYALEEISLLKKKSLSSYYQTESRTKQKKMKMMILKHGRLRHESKK